MTSPIRRPRHSAYHRACINCRRKKTRCPGERPACSSCTRLKQSCSYRAGAISSDECLSHPVEGVAGLLPVSSYKPQLEELNLIYNQSPHPEPRFSISDITGALDLYFHCCHRQPIWLFERDEIESENVPTQLIYSILALTSRFRQKQQSYDDHVRHLVMKHMASGTVDLQTIESLCLLSLHFFIDGRTQLGELHLNLGFQLYRLALLDSPTGSGITMSLDERKRRLFWSLQLLEQSFGGQPGLIGRMNICRPEGEDGLARLPALPNSQDLESGVPGIWNAVVLLGWVWSKTRAYISECARNGPKEPWRHDSTYSIVYSYLMDSENCIPMCHRWQCVKFYDRTADDIKNDLSYWKPWLRSQMMYHVIHIVLNHPFIYIIASQHNQNLAIPNTFWRRSSELALLHATWVVRMIDMIQEKQVQLHDSFFGHAAAIASTIHLYYCCAADNRLKQKSGVDLEKCRKFLKNITPYSQACEALDNTLDEMTRIAFQHGESSKIRLSIRLVWDILQSSPSPNSDRKTSGLFHQSLTLTDPEIPDESILEIVVTTSPIVTVDTADGGQAVHATSVRGVPSSTEMSDVENLLVAPADSLMADTAWMWADSSQFMSGVHLENESGDENPGVSTWWNFGDL